MNKTMDFSSKNTGSWWAEDRDGMMTTQCDACDSGGGMGSGRAQGGVLSQDIFGCEKQSLI